MLKIQVLCDNPDSWMVPYAKELTATLFEKGHDAVILHDPRKVEAGDILVMLSCEKIFRKLNLNKHNLVVHESDLPSGKGWSPLTWQVIEGKNEIPVTLIEATESVDAGPIYAQEWMSFDGSELVHELREKQGNSTKKLILDFINSYPNIKAKPQEGEESFYPRRTQKDSELDPYKTIAEQFNILRVVDNERYPAYFKHKGATYKIKIEKIR